MANDLTGNPITVDTAATVWTKHKLVAAMQWIDDDNAAGGIIADTETLAMTMNGVEIQICCADISQVSPMAWSVSWPAPMNIEKLVVDTIDGGTLLIWLA